MAAPKGNQFWKVRTKHGRDKLFASHEALWEACCEYFQWVDDNPLIEMRPFAYQGVVVQEPVPKMRAMTKAGLCLFLKMDQTTWNRWKEGDDEDFRRVTRDAEEIIYLQKFTGAASDFFNANIIARDLGLKDSQAHEHSGGITVDDNVSDEERAERIAAILERARNRRTGSANEE